MVLVAESVGFAQLTESDEGASKTCFEATGDIALGIYHPESYVPGSFEACLRSTVDPESYVAGSFEVEQASGESRSPLEICDAAELGAVQFLGEMANELEQLCTRASELREEYLKSCLSYQSSVLYLLKGGPIRLILCQRAIQVFRTRTE
ncbi:unnamed protein product, partial [Mycena citricolor]